MLELPKVVSAASPPAGKHQSVTSSRAAALAGPELSALHALLNQGVSASLRAREAAEKYFYQSASACQATDNDDGIPNAVQEEIKRHHRQTSSSSALSSASSADRAWTSREAAHKSAQHRRICVLYPKILDEELLTHNKHRSGKMKGVLPGPRESLHGDKLRGFCDDVLRDSAAQVKHLSLTSTEAIPVVKRTKADVTKADFLERSSKGSGVMAPPPDTLTLYTSSCACITELIIAGALALSEHLSPTQCPTESPGTPGRLPGEFLRDNADVPVGAGWEEGGWQELAYEACKRAQQLCLLLYPRLERLGLMGGAMSATLDKFQAAAANNLGCIYVSGSKPHAALYYLEQALKYQDAGMHKFFCVYVFVDTLRGMRALFHVRACRYKHTHIIHTGTFETEDAAGTHLNAASALAQLSQHDAAIAHCRCALAGLHNMINNNNNSDQSSEAIEKGAAQHSQARSKGARLKAHKARCALAAAQDRMGLGLILLASLHEAAGNLHEAAAAWVCLCGCPCGRVGVRVWGSTHTQAITHALTRSHTHPPSHTHSRTHTRSTQVHMRRATMVANRDVLVSRRSDQQLCETCKTLWISGDRRCMPMLAAFALRRHCLCLPPRPRGRSRLKRWRSSSIQLHQPGLRRTLSAEQGVWGRVRT